MQCLCKVLMRQTVNQLSIIMVVLCLVLLCWTCYMKNDTGTSVEKKWYKHKLLEELADNYEEKIEKDKYAVKLKDGLQVYKGVQTKVIILTYLRSGSSFTGDLLQQHPDVFYVYEPLYTLFTHLRQQYNRTTKEFLHYLNNASMPFPDYVEELEELIVGVMNHTLNCQADKLTVQTLMVQAHMLRSKSTKQFRICAHYHNYTQDVQGFKQCLANLLHQCRQASTTVVKVIRARMRHVEDLLASDPKVKVIHLIRDPRGSLRSRNMLVKDGWGNVKLIAKTTCSNIEGDILESLRLSRIYKNRILTVRYEDIVYSPIEATRQMYAFLNLTLSPDIEKYTWNITYGGIADDCNVCTIRSNASLTANAWRRDPELDSQTLQTIQLKCSLLLKMMGYRQFTTEKDRMDFQILATYDTFSPSLLKVSI